ncbi:transcriptional regulator [Flammeovirgaceae bacterium 311]|nr:transcriptional regulator [Flammeovirgaceae bacterium 311]
MKKKQTGIRDLARALNVSPSTVSKALNGVTQIKPQTRRAVEEMAKRMNYQPNQIAQNLRNNKTNILGVIVPNLISHFFAATISGIQDVAAAHGYNVIICQSNESFQKEEKLIQTLIASRVDGLLMSLSRETESFDHIQSIFAKRIPLVLFDRVCNEVTASKVTVDDHDGAFNATEHLIEKGYSRIAHISGPEHLSISKSRLAGYVDAHLKHSLEIDEVLIRHTNMLGDEVATQTQALLDLPNPPDAIFSINDLVATQVMSVIKSRGLRIPDDIALIGFTNIPEATLLEPSLTTVAQPAYELGEISATHILKQIQAPEDFKPQEIVLKTKLIARESTSLRKLQSIL